MSCKIFSLALILLTTVPSLAQHPADSPAALLQFGQYYQPYFEQAFKQFTKDTIYAKDCMVDASFVIDTSGSPKSIQVTAADCNEKFKSYVLKMVEQTKHNWQPAIKNCRKVMSDTIYCRFILYSPLVTSAERMDAIENELRKEYYSGQKTSEKSTKDVQFIILRLGV